MRRSPDPERAYEDRRWAMYSRLTDEEGLDERDAEHWIAAWERHAEEQGVERLKAAFWTAGEVWIDARRKARN